MRLSVVIVNYNVLPFLEQALLSVRKAMQGIDGDVWVVDNNSSDDSVRMVRERFPEVRLIANTTNPGFAVANNQAIRQSTGEFVLLLNPDTIVEEDCFHLCLKFMDEHSDAGALGVKLLDGSGTYLPESKRGFPSPWVAFCKTVGLARFFPKSRLFNGYYLGHLGEDETNPVDVLAGCFMFIRRATLGKAGLLDEAFFMYGEDIDLSYRINQAGYQNYYFPHTRILHYKGESTKKGSLNYVRAFYQAMIIFARKHFVGKRVRLFVLMLQMAIWLRAGLALLFTAARKVWLPAVDAVLIFAGLVMLKDFWANYYYKDPHYFKAAVLCFNFPLYTVVWLLSVWLSGGYDRRFDLNRLLRGIGIGTILLAAIYGFLDLEYRPSRALLLLGGAWSALSLAALRTLLHLAEFRNLHIGRERVRNLVIAGSPSECARVQELLARAGIVANVVGSTADALPAHGEKSTLSVLARVFRADEIVFCTKDIPVQDVLAWMRFFGKKIACKTLPEGGQHIIGSSNKNEPGEVYTIDIRYNIAQPGQRRNKRVLDLGICLFTLASLPLCFLFFVKTKPLLQYWLHVLLARKTWVGYAPAPEKEALPSINPCVFSPVSGWKNVEINAEMATQLNFLYARDWNVWQDLEILRRVVFH